MIVFRQGGMEVSDPLTAWKLCQGLTWYSFSASFQDHGSERYRCSLR